MHIEIIGSLWGVPLAFEYCRCSQTLFNVILELSVQSNSINKQQYNNQQTYMHIHSEQTSFITLLRKICLCMRCKIFLRTRDVCHAKKSFKLMQGKNVSQNE